MKGKVSPAPSIVHLSQGPPQPAVLVEGWVPAGTAADLLSQPVVLFSWGKKGWRSGKEWLDGATPKEATGKIRYLDFTVTLTCLSQTQAKERGCSEPVCLAKELAHCLQWISWRYALFLTLVLSPWQTQLPPAERHLLLLTLAPSLPYSVRY